MNAGQTLFKPYVGDLLWHDGVVTYMHEGIATGIVDGERPLVRQHTLLSSADGWHETRRQALIAMADQVSERARLLLAQVDRIRTEIRNLEEDHACIR